MKNAVVLLNVVFLHSQTTRASTQRTPTTNIMRIRHSQFGIRTMQHLTVFFYVLSASLREGMNIVVPARVKDSEHDMILYDVLQIWIWNVNRLNLPFGRMRWMRNQPPPDNIKRKLHDVGHCWDFLNFYQCLNRKKTASIFLSKHTAIFRHIVASSAASSPVFQVVTDLEVSRCQRTRFPVTARVPKLNAIAETILMGMRWR